MGEKRKKHSAPATTGFFYSFGIGAEGNVHFSTMIVDVREEKSEGTGSDEKWERQLGKLGDSLRHGPVEP